MDRFWGIRTTRTVCDVLEEIRQLEKTKNYGPLLGLVEEIQSMANRMEAKLTENRDVVRAENYIKKLKQKIKKLEAKKDKLDGNEDD